MKIMYKNLVMLLLPLVLVVGCKEDYEDKLTGTDPEPNTVDVSSRLSGFDQEVAEKGTTVTMSGQGLSGVNHMLVAGEFIGEVEATETSVSFIVPDEIPIGEQEFTFIFSGNERAKANIEVIARQVPIIQAVSPSAAAPGEQVTILGSAFMNIESVTIGGMDVEIDDSSTEEELIITVPAGLELYAPAPIVVTTSRGEATSETFYVGENLIFNGQFELGEGEDFEGWAKANTSVGILTIADPANSYAGRSLKAVSGSATQPWQPQMFSTAVATQIGRTYRLLVTIKGLPGPGDGGDIRFSTTGTAMYSPDFVVSADWQQIMWEFTANVASTQMVLDLGGVEGAEYVIDNVTLIPGGPPQPVELLLNGGFEEGTGDDFTNWTKQNAADLLTATTNAAEVKSGSRALVAEGFGQDEWRTQIASDAMETIVDREYTASFWIKGKDGTPGNGGLVRMSTAGTGSTAQYQGNVTVTAEWQKVEWTIAANGPLTQLVLDLGETEGAVYFVDDVSFLELPE